MQLPSAVAPKTNAFAPTCAFYEHEGCTFSSLSSHFCWWLPSHRVRTLLMYWTRETRTPSFHCAGRTF